MGRLIMDEADYALMDAAVAARQKAARAKLPEIAEDAASVGVGSDRYPASVIGDEGGIISIQYDDDVVVSGSIADGSAKYEYYRNPHGMVRHFKRNKKGRYVEVVMNERGRMVQSGYSGYLHLGRRNRYYDPHF